MARRRMVDVRRVIWREVSSEFLEELEARGGT